MKPLNSLAVDLGSANTRIFASAGGLILNEPSVITLNRSQKEVIAIGTEAKEMLGRTPGDIECLCPIAHGAVTDLVAMKALFRYFMKVIHASRIPFLKPSLIIAIPYQLTDTERRVLVDVAIQAGFQESGTHLLEQSVATAVAGGMDVLTPNGHMIVDVGGGKTEVSVISLGGVVTSASCPYAGETMDEQIIKFVLREMGVVIGVQTAEQIKIRVANAYFDPTQRETFMEFKGRDAKTGLPRTANISNFQAAMAIRESVDEIARAVMACMEHTPPELAADIWEGGITLSGGSALLHGLDQVLSEKTGLPVHLIEDPTTAVIRGAGIVMYDLNKYKQTLVPLSSIL